MLGALLSSVGGALLGHGLAKDRQADAQDFSAQQFANRYQTTVQDMKAAGLNPMLAYSQGGGNAPTSSAASAQSSDLSQAYLQSKLNSAQIANIEAQTAKTQAETNIISETGLDQAKATLNKTLVDAGLSSSQIAKVNSETQNIIQSLNNIKSEDERLKQAAKMLNQQSQLFSQQTMTEAQRVKLVEEQAKLVVAQTGLANLEIDAAKSLGNIGREFGQLKPVIDVLLQLISMGRPRGGGIVINK